MTIDTNSDHYQKGLELAEAGRLSEALDVVQGYLRAAPNNPEILNDIGAILHGKGQTSEAILHFSRALSLQPDSVQIMWNLSEAYLAVGRADEALELFDQMERSGILSADILNRAANVFLEQDDKGNAIEMLLRSLQLSPEQTVLEPMVRVIRSKRPKVAFFCGADGMTFLNDIIKFAEQRFETRVFNGKTDAELRELMEWSDISWFEWCTNLAVTASNMPKTCKMIVRLHRYEAYELWPRQVNWSNIDVLVTVGNQITRQTLLNKVPYLESQTSIEVIPNGVDLDKFEFRQRTRGKNIAFLANLRPVKNPSFMLQCMQKLHYIDPEYRLFFAGEIQDEVLECYLKQMINELGLRDVVFFDGWQSDVNAWLADKHYIVSTSICEGHPVGILEAMACGLKPVIHNFLGAEGIFPREFLFNISEQFCEQILSEDYEPYRYRGFIEEKYSLARQLHSVNELFVRFEKEVAVNSFHPVLNIGTISKSNKPAFENVGVR